MQEFIFEKVWIIITSFKNIVTEYIHVQKLGASVDNTTLMGAYPNKTLMGAYPSGFFVGFELLNP
jgi:hypothetical protein